MSSLPGVQGNTRDGVISGEPAHVHVQRDAATAKYWLAPVRLENNAGYRPSELRRIRSIISANRPQLLEAWDEFFGRAG